MFVSPRPRNKDYEKLIRRLASTADLDNLKLLLHSPILELAKVDIYACNEKGENVLDVLQNYKSKYPHLKKQYDECEKILATYQEPTSKDIPSWGRIFYRAAAFLPSFNHATAVSTTIAMMGAGVYLFSDDTNKSNRRLTL